MLFILAVASAAVFGLINLTSGLADSSVLGIPVHRLIGLLPIIVGLLVLREALSSDSDDDASDPDTLQRRRGYQIFGWGLIGAQIYLVNSLDDLVLHLGVLGGVLRNSGGAVVGLIAAFWIGNLLGEFSSLAAAHWLAGHFRARRTLEVGAALTIIGVGIVLLLT